MISLKQGQHCWLCIFQLSYKNKIAIIINFYCYYVSASSTYFVPVSINPLLHNLF